MSAEPPRGVWFLGEAEDDIAAAFLWYETKRVGLGADFMRTLDSTLAALIEFPEACPIVFRHTRRCLMGRFPFEIL